MPGTERYIGPVETAIRELLLPALLRVLAGEVKGDLRTLLGNSAMQGGLNVRYSTEAAVRLHVASSQANETLAASLIKGDILNIVLHKQTVRKGGAEERKERQEEKEVVLDSLSESKKPNKQNL